MQASGCLRSGGKEQEADLIPEGFLEVLGLLTNLLLMLSACSIDVVRKEAERQVRSYVPESSHSMDAMVQKILNALFLAMSATQAFDLTAICWKVRLFAREFTRTSLTR